LVNKNAGHNAIKIGILEFCGVKPVNISVFTSVKSADIAKRKKWIDEVETLGRQHQ
jgi:putative NADPH-quinone reductase